MGDITSIGFDTIPITFRLKYRGIDYPNDYFLQKNFSGEQTPPRRQNYFGQCTILGVKIIFRTTALQLLSRDFISFFYAKKRT
jgi:hypothetical protein